MRDDIKGGTELRKVDLVEDDLPARNKVSRIWGETRGGRLTAIARWYCAARTANLTCRRRMLNGTSRTGTEVPTPPMNGFATCELPHDGTTLRKSRGLVVGA